jgi:hypothetical protein
LKNGANLVILLKSQRLKLHTYRENDEKYREF